jgi:hypothetical protein
LVADRLREKLIEIGATVSHGRYLTLQLADVAV